MTVTSDNKLIGRMLDLLNKLGISQRDCDLAERYLREEVDDEVLKQFVRKDLSMPSYNLYSEGWTITRQVNKSANRTVFVRFDTRVKRSRNPLASLTGLSDSEIDDFQTGMREIMRYIKSCKSILLSMKKQQDDIIRHMCK